MRRLRVVALILICLLIALVSALSAKSKPVVQFNQSNARFSEAQVLAAGMNAQAMIANSDRPGEGFEPSNFGADQKNLQSAMFMPAVNFSSGGTNTMSVAIGDLNGDGFPDLVIPSECANQLTCDGVVGVLLGNGDGTFRPPVAYSSGGALAVHAAIGDVNHDGHPDLFVVNICQSDTNCSIDTNGSVSVLLGNGDGTFQPPISYSSGGYGANWVAIADLNGDGHPDLIVLNVCQGGTSCGDGAVAAVSIFLGNGDGTFQPPAAYSTGGYGATSAAMADLNGDGKMDLVVANVTSNSVGVLLGNGDGTFRSPVLYDAMYPNSIAIADLNGDGHPDFVVANGCPNSGCTQGDGGVSVFLGNGDGTFQAPITHRAGGVDALSVAIADVNGDGRPDLAVTNCESSSNCDSPTSKGEVSVLRGNGDGTFQNPVKYSSGGLTANFVAIGDVNRDGKPDLVVANGNSNAVGMLLNNFTAATSTKIISLRNPGRRNQPVTFKATVKSSSSVPNGSVITFYNGATEIGSGTTTDGGASLTVSFSAIGKYIINAQYPGDAFHSASSGTVNQVVNP